MLIEKQTAEKAPESALTVVRKKSRRQPSVKVISMTKAVTPSSAKADLFPPVNQFNTGYIKVKKHDPL